MFETVILGAGPAGTGPLVWAAANGVLAAWLDKGIAIIDAQPQMGGSVGRYTVNADTLSGTFVESLYNPCAEPVLTGLRDDALTQALQAWQHDRPPLEQVGQFLTRLGAEMIAEIARHPRSLFLGSTQARRLDLMRDGSVAVRLAIATGRRVSLRAASAVMALGGRQQGCWDTVELLPGLALRRWSHKILASDELLALGGTQRARALLTSARAAPLVVVLGGSHSALSAAWLLLEQLPGVSFADGGVWILYRAPPRMFYASRAEAAADGYAFGEADVCQATGRVNRLGGLRGDGRALWRRICAMPDTVPERRAVARCIRDLRVERLWNLLDATDMIVPAFGYRLATIPIHGADGQRIALSRGSVQVGPDARLLTEDNRALPNVFGVGLGSGFRPWGGMAGEASFGGQQNSLWLYQNGLGKLIHDGVRAHAAVRRGRVRGWRHVVLSSLRAGCVGVPPKAEPALTIGERTPLPPAAG